MRSMWTVAAFTAVLLGFVTPLFAQEGKAGDQKGPAQQVEKAYVFADIDELRRHPEDFRDKAIRLSDRFESISNLYPRTLARVGITPDKYLEFVTSSSYGSNMRCYLSGTNKDAVGLVSNLTRFAPVTLEGAVYGVVNTMTIFMVDNIYSGYEVPKKAGKPQITMILQWEGDANKYKYVISRPGQFILTDPTTNKRITMELQY